MVHAHTCVGWSYMGAFPNHCQLFIECCGWNLCCLKGVEGRLFECIHVYLYLGQLSFTHLHVPIGLHVHTGACTCRSVKTHCETFLHVQDQVLWQGIDLQLFFCWQDGSQQRAVSGRALYESCWLQRVWKVKVGSVGEGERVTVHHWSWKRCAIQEVRKGCPVGVSCLSAEIEVNLQRTEQTETKGFDLPFLH